MHDWGKTCEGELKLNESDLYGNDARALSRNWVFRFARFIHKDIETFKRDKKKKAGGPSSHLKSRKCEFLSFAPSFMEETCDLFHSEERVLLAELIPRLKEKRTSCYLWQMNQNLKNESWSLTITQHKWTQTDTNVVFRPLVIKQQATSWYEFLHLSFVVWMKHKLERVWAPEAPWGAISDSWMSITSSTNNKNFLEISRWYYNLKFKNSNWLKYQINKCDQ